MDITRAAIEKNRITIVVILVLLFAGIQSYISMPRAEDPGFTIRVARVITYFPGASPERVELLLTDKLEMVIQEIPELDVVISESMVGTSVIDVEIKKHLRDMRPIWDNLRRKLDDVLHELPKGVIGPFVNDEFGDVYGTVYMLTGEDYENRELREIAKEIRNELLLLLDVSKVSLYGVEQEQVIIEFDNATLAEFGLTPRQLESIIEARNIILPGGDIRLDYEQIVLEPSGNFEDVDQIRRAVINIPGQEAVVRLGDIVKVKRGYADPPSTLTHSNGKPAIAIALAMRDGGNIIEMGKQVKLVIDRALQNYPLGIDVDELTFQADIVDKKISDFIVNLYQAIALVALVMLLFLGLRTGLIVASLIPATMVTTMLVMRIFNIGIDQMSLASLIIALGMLVDNAIVMSESIMVQMQNGIKAKVAAIASAGELKIPLLVSSLTTSAAFLPIFLAEAEMGEYTASIFSVVTMALITSWLMALTLIPLLCVLFLKVKKSDVGSDRFDTKFYRLYRGLLNKVLRFRWLTLAMIGFVFFLSIQGLKYLDKIFVPDNDRPTFTVELEFPVGTPIDRNKKVVAELERFMKEKLMENEKQPGINDWGSFIGSGAPRFVLSYSPESPRPEYTYIVANATDIPTINNILIPQLENYIVNNFPDIKPTLKPLPMGSLAWPPISVRISGRDTDDIFKIVEAVKAKLREMAGVKQISDDWGARTKKVIFNINEERAQRAGVSNQEIAESMQTFINGMEISDYRERDELIPILLRSRGDRSVRYNRIKTLNIYSQSTQTSVPLNQVGTTEVVWQYSNIKRRQRLQTVTVEALLEPGFTAMAINLELLPWLNEQMQSWPFGYSWEYGGEWETTRISQQAIFDKLPIAGMLIILLLVGQFNSFRRAAIILFTIPLALIGVVAGLLITGYPFGFMSLLGLISLAGIVINNAIVLIDRIGIEINENGLTPAAAITQSCQQRLRPILLTSLTTVGGMIPLWLGGGPFWESMAVSIIFGIIFATVLTLGVVPLLYSLFFRVKFD